MEIFSFEEIEEYEIGIEEEYNKVEESAILEE